MELRAGRADALKQAKDSAFDTPVMRDVDRTEQPSTSAVMTATFFTVLITFAIN
jgi:hypothetical protein